MAVRTVHYMTYDLGTKEQSYVASKVVKGPRAWVSPYADVIHTCVSLHQTSDQMHLHVVIWDIRGIIRVSEVSGMKL